MSKDKNSLTGRGLLGTLASRFFTALFLYTVALVVLLYAAILVLSSLTWYKTDLIYQLLSPINNNRVLFLVILWLFGFVLISVYYLKKIFGYISAIADASNKLVEPSEDFIHLPLELKQVEDQMNQAKQVASRNARLAKEAEQRKNDLIVYLAHDLKTPLTSVIGYLTLLRDEGQISDELREKYLSISLEKAERLEDLINEFFEITRFSLSQLTLEPSRVNLTRMLEQIVFEFAPLFDSKNLQCNLQIPPDLELQIDVNKMERVFDNLIRNAINYSFENSIITITVNRTPKGVVLRFKNQGNTIQKEKLDRVFEQFYRLDTSRATKTGGAGLGLAIAKEIVELHHGTITAHSEKDEIEFIVFLAYKI